MESILGFFSDLILFTAGLAVAILWIVLFIVIVIETHDLIKGTSPSPEDEDPYRRILEEDR